MKMNRKLPLFMLMAMLSFAPAFGQVLLKSLVAFNYSYGKASGDLNTFIPRKSFRGANFDYRYFYKRELSFGFQTGWNSFKKKFPRAVFETDKGTLSAVQTRYFYTFPFLLNIDYYLRSSHYIMPYVGGGLGPYLVNYEKWYGVVNFRNQSLHFGLRPEAGVIIPIGNTGLGFNINGKYNYVFYAHNEIRNLNYFEFCAGVYFGYF